MGMEIELKLAVAPHDAARVRRFVETARATVIQGPRRARVYNVYFDTPDLLLQRHGMALRMRKLRGRWFATLKTAGTGTGGLHRRGEWEWPLPDAALDLALFADTPLAALKQSRALHTLLTPAFVTDFMRTTWLLEPTPGTRIEFALDQGTVSCADRAEPISEVELELVGGDADALFDMALALNASVPAQPSAISKAERGYRLFSAAPLRAVKALPVKLDAAWPPDRALVAVATECLRHYGANVRGALETDDAEFIHQMRVALRRLRSALRMFRRPDAADASDIAPQIGAEAGADLRWLTGVLGEARDWDVFIDETLPPLSAALRGAEASGAKGLLDRAASQRAIARSAVRAAITSPRHAALMLSLMRELHGLDTQSGEDMSSAKTDGTDNTDSTHGKDGTGGSPLASFASRRIAKRHRRLLRDARGLAVLDAEGLHRLRIDAKKLRYTVDFFSSLFGKRSAGYLDTLAEIQGILGEANDAATGLGLIEILDAPPALKPFAAGWFAARTNAAQARLESLFRSLVDARRFWRGGKHGH